MQIYNWNYRDWYYQNKYRQNMIYEERMIPQAPVVREISEEDGKENKECLLSPISCKVKTERGMATYNMFEEFDGYLSLEIKYSYGEHRIIKKIIDCMHMRAHFVCDATKKKKIVCIIGVNDLADRLILFDKNISPDGLEKLLILKRIPILVEESKRKVVMNMVFMYLMDNATFSELPDSVGWIKK